MCINVCIKRENFLDPESRLTYALYCIVLIRLRFLWAVYNSSWAFASFSRSVLVLRYMNKRFALCALSVLLAGFTASCGPLTGAPKGKTAADSAPSAESTLHENAQPTTSSALEVPPPVALPPSYGERPPKPGETQTTTMPNGLPALQPKGVNVGDLFAENITDSNKRFERLENAVTGLRQEFESFKPAIVRLVAVESDIQDLIRQLDILLRNEPTAPPEPLTPQPEEAQLSSADQAEPPAPPPPAQDPPVPRPKEQPPPLSQPTPQAAGPFVVNAMRMGQHSDKLRLVLDASGETAFNVDLDNQENLLVIELPEAGWNAEREGRYDSSPLIRSYSVESMGEGRGSRVILSLKKPTQLLKQQALPPGNNPNYRIFLDLKL